MKVPKLTIPEYRKEYIKLIEAQMRLTRKVESLEKTNLEENRRRVVAILELAASKKRIEG